MEASGRKPSQVTCWGDGKVGTGGDHLGLDAHTSCLGPEGSQRMGGNKTSCLKRAGFWFFMTKW